MIPIKTALAAAALAALAAPAAADPAFDAFDAVCTGTHTDYPDVVEAVQKNGWIPTTTTGDTTMPGVTVTDRIAVFKKVGDKSMTISAWRGTKGDVKITACTMRVPKADFEALKSAAQGWTGFAPQDVKPTKVTFRFSETPTGRHALAAAEYDTAAGSEGMEILSVSTDPHGAVLDVLKIKK